MAFVTLRLKRKNMRPIPRYSVGDKVHVKAPFIVDRYTQSLTGGVDCDGTVEALSPSLDPREGITYWVRLEKKENVAFAPCLPCKDHELKLLSRQEPAATQEPFNVSPEVPLHEIPAPKLAPGTYVYVNSVLPALRPHPGIEGVIEKASGPDSKVFDYWVLIDSIRPGEPFPIKASEVQVNHEMRHISPKTMLRIVRYRDGAESLKETAHRLLSEFTQPLPGQVYEHYKGGLYDIVAVSLDEETLEPLVTYKSRKYGSTNTRTRNKFLWQVVRDTKGNCLGGKPRFMRQYVDPAPKPFARYCVVNLNQHPMKFTMWHASYTDAGKEAERLAKQVPGSRFSVLSEMATVQVPLVPSTPKWEGMDIPKLESKDDCPF